jgi:hypothetical protein
MDLYLLNELNKLEEGGASTGSTGFSGMFLPNKQDGTSATKFVTPVLTRWSARYEYDNWNYTSDGPHTTMYTYMENNYDCEFFAHSIAGGGDYSGNTQSSHSNGNKPEVKYSKTFYAGTWNNTMGLDRGDSYNPYRVTALFVKNPTNSNINKNIYFFHSNYWSSGHDGCGLAVGVPNSTDKASVSSLSWNRIQQRTSQSTYYDTHATSFTFPANKTVIVLLAATNHYWTAGSTITFFNDACGFYNLHDLFDNGLEADLEMTQAVHQGRIQWQGDAENNFYQYWNRCAAHFPPQETP